MYKIEACTLPLTHGSVYILGISENGYILDVDWFEGGYSEKYVRIHYLTSENKATKNCYIKVFERGHSIEDEIESAIPLKTIIITERIFLIMGEFL